MNEKYMSIKLFTIAILTLFAATACVQPLANQQDGANKNTNSSDTAMEDDKDDAMMEDDKDDAMMEDDKDDADQKINIEWSSFENRSVAYQIRHPQNWYWRHYIEPEISSDTVFDYFIVDPVTPPSFASNPLGAIVVAASTEDVENVITDTKAELARIVEGETIIEGITAPRIQGVIREGEMEGVTVVMYIFNRRGVTYTFTMKKQGPTEHEMEIFEEMVRSFRFN